MTKLQTLSLGRNKIKKIEKLEDVALTLKHLWISYNQISSLEGLSCLKNLTTLYMSNNAIKSFSELNHLVSRWSWTCHLCFFSQRFEPSHQASLENLKDVLFVWNPMYDEASDREEARLRVLARLPQVIKIDGQLVKPSEVEAARRFSED